MKTTNFRFAVLCGAFALTAVGFADTYAVCMGINRYPVPVDGKGNPFKDEKGNPVSANLNGAVNDASSMRDLLVGKYKVKTENIKFLTDDAANAAGFLDAIRWLIKNAKSGDNIVFSYSGHGTTIDDKDKPNGKSSAIVLSDNKLVTGNFFKEVSAAMRKGGVNATFVFDSCFAGGMSRDPIPWNEVKTMGKKFLVPGKTLSAKASAVAKTTLNGVVSAAKALPAKQDAKGEVAFLFASQDNQTSSDLTFKDATKPAHGVFTLLLEAILTDVPAAPLSELMDAIKKVLKEKGFAQVPNSDFSSEDRAKAPLVIGG